MQKLRMGFGGPDSGVGLIEARPLYNLFGYSKGVPTATTGWEKGAIIVDITNGVVYRNDGSLTAATWTKLAAVGDTLATLTVTALTAGTAAITTATVTTANVTTVVPTHIQPAQGASTTALGTNSGTAAVLPAATGVIYPVAAADDTVGVRIHANDNVTNNVLFIANKVSNKILKIYPPTGGTINGAAADAAYSTASGKGALIVCLDSTANTATGAFAAIG